MALRKHVRDLEKLITEKQIKIQRIKGGIIDLQNNQERMAQSKIGKP